MKKDRLFFSDLKLCVVFVLCISFMVVGAPASAAPKVLKAVGYRVMDTTQLSMVAYKIFIDKFNERAKGEIRINYLGGPEVIPPGEQMNALSKGVVQLLVTPGYHTSIVPEVDAILLSDITPLQQREVGFNDVMAEIHKKRLGVLPLGRVDHGVPFHLFTNEKVQKLDDFAGLKFRSNANYDPFFKKLGIISVAMPMGDIYTALQRGLVVGFPLPIFISKLRLQEVVKYVVDHGWWRGGAVYLYINLKTWDNLPENIRNMMTEVAMEMEREVIHIAEKLVSEERKRLADAGMTFIKLTPPDGERLVEIASDVKWEQIVRKSPEYGPKMKAMIKKK